jgi:tetratricopeptide (TPR) repeat protein
VPEPQEFRVFLSAVSSEFETARNELANDFESRNVLVRVQRSFRQEAGSDTLLRLLHHYISKCTAVVCVMGERSGSFPTAAEAMPFTHILPAGFSEASYTQWEFFFARHYERRLSIYIARKGYKPDRNSNSTDCSDHQHAFLTYVRKLGLHYTEFSEVHELCRRVAIEDWPAKVARKPRNLPYASLGPVFKGREEFLDRLHDSIPRTQDGHAAAVTGKALYGLGGIGKTRLAIEYGLRHASEHSALLFVSAETPERLAAGLATLASRDILDLPEKDAREDEVKITAALKWLDEHPGWLMILDNVDDDKAAAAVEEFVARLKGGHVLITGCTGDFSAVIETFPLDVLSENDAASLLLDSTKKREKAPNDDALVHELARELGGLPYALAQASAYIDKQRTSFTHYLELWRERRETVLDWFDKRLVSYNHDVGLAATWTASVEKLTPPGRQLLELCAFLDPAPIPKFLLHVPVPFSFDAPEALADLFAYSLASPVAVADRRATEPAFAVHRLLQDFVQRRLEAGKHKQVMEQALGWINAAFVGDPEDVRTWPVLDPLAPHALAVAGRADKAGIPDLTARLMNQVALLFNAKTRYAEAERLMRPALAIIEASYGPDHPSVAATLNNLARLLQDTDRLAEAEPLMRRALAITEASYGPDHPSVADTLNNLAGLLYDTSRRTEAEPLYRRALEITESNYGSDHPRVAIALNNLAKLLQDTRPPEEAEPLFRRALAIDEASYGPDHPAVARDLSNLAGLLRATDRPAQAEPLMRRALAIDEASYGPDHPKVAMRLNNLAGLLKSMNHFAEAEPMYRRALAIDEASNGPDHPKVAIRLNNLAGLLQATNRLEEAEPLMRRQVEILLSFTARTGHQHPNLLASFGNYAGLLVAMGRSEAEAIAAVEALVRKHGVEL